MRLIFKTLSVFGFFALFLGCEVPFEDNARLLIKGEILDENNEPLSGADIVVVTREGEGFLFGTPTELLGESQSASDGSFSIITLFGRDEKFTVEVSVNENYSKYAYITNTETFTPTDYLIDLGTIPIKRKAQFNFNITRTSPPDTEFQYTLEYKNSICNEVYIEEQLNGDDTICFETESFGRLLNNERPEASGSFITFVGSEVLFLYSINGQPQEIQTITIDQPDYEFNFSY